MVPTLLEIQLNPAYPNNYLNIAFSVQNLLFCFKFLYYLILLAYFEYFYSGI